MSDYFQPEFYRFNRDSLELIRQVKTKVRTSDSILDLGAGCGIIGIELAAFYRPARLTLLELQEDFRSSLEKNTNGFLPAGITSEVVFKSFGEFKPLLKFDLIVCNPPYYLPGKGEPSRDPRRGLARTFTRDSWKELLGCIECSLMVQGKAFLVVKNEASIKHVIEEVLRSSNLKMVSEVFEDLLFCELTGLDIN